MNEDESGTVSLPRGDVIAISRLLWDIGSAEGTSHRHEVDCFHWGAVLDHRAGLPPYPTPGEPTAMVIEFFEGVRRHLDEMITDLRTSEGS